MKPILLKDNSIVIEWYEPKNDGSPIKHTMKREAIKVQFHPIHKDDFVRLYFEGEMPAWIKKFATAKKYKCQETSYQGKKGWWLSNWSIWEEWKPFSAPTILGAFRQFIRGIPSALAGEKERLELEAEDVMNRILTHNQDYYDYGLVYLPAAVGGGGVVAINTSIIKKTGEEQSEMDGWIKLVNELLLPLPEKVDEDENEGYEEIEDEEMVDSLLLGELDFLEEDGSMNFSDNEFILDDVNPEENQEEEGEYLLVEATPLDFEEVADFPVLEIVDEDFLIVDEEDSYPNPIPIIEANGKDKDFSASSLVDTKVDTKIGEYNTLKASKKHNIVAGQISLF